ncbi:patatin-like protein [Pseudoduganella sp. FT55W]|uniref:Patatin-like protein n=1 Tax=Duganella rivi TaxID=2666083 RepID=A0A7X4KAQ6_9BURK|nr:patatin-like protein [Duganella rivi]MYM66355.1 patatin-like protein [Duganella rivi]
MSSQQQADYVNEIRFGVVMYGGVSLAIYINGVSNELFELACATPAQGLKQAATGTRELYQRMSWLAANPQLRAAYAREIKSGKPDPWQGVSTATCTQTRFTVDAISGTSAGGINGIFLAKSLANGEQFGMLKDLWIREGDFGLLLNDAATYKNFQASDPKRSEQPKSLLNSDRMYAKLLEAFESQSQAQDQLGGPITEEVDLYVTTTDINGSKVKLRLFDKVVDELRYKQNFHFSCDHAAGHNDFTEANNPFFAFAARCTSSFPFAFEPMTLATVRRLAELPDDASLSQWSNFFPNLPSKEVEGGKHIHRAFGDGGYLDNKPFSYVVDVLARRQAIMPLERKLIYVEPAPQHIKSGMPEAGQQPDALQNSLAALTSIPQYETIREDLQAVLQRNRRIERIERLVRQGEASVDQLGDGALTALLCSGADTPNWGTMSMAETLRLYGPAFLAYRRQRAYAVTDELANRLGVQWGIVVDSDEQYALRALVRVWREATFKEDGEEKINAFLDQFDFEFRIRRLGFVLRRTDQLTHLFRKFLNGHLDAQYQPLPMSEVEEDLLQKLPAPFNALKDGGVPRADLDGALRTLARIKAVLVSDRKELHRLHRATPSRPADEITKLRPQLIKVFDNLLGRGNWERANPELKAAARQASLCRTLQESVVVRAKAVYHATAGRYGPLKEALESNLEAMRFKHEADQRMVATGFERASENSWEMLGRPRLTCDTDGLIVVEVAAVAGEDELNSVHATALRRFLGGYFARFDSYDQISFPLYSDTGTGEPCTVEVVRISPADATNLINETKSKGRRKLAGTALANFGAFLDRRWRVNDVMWGRLDGAERLIQTVLPMTDDDTAIVRKELIQRAHDHILKEALLDGGRVDLTTMLIEALREAGNAETLSAYLRQQVVSMCAGTAAAHKQMERILIGLLSEPALADYVRHHYAFPPAPEPQPTMKSGARAITIVGRMLETISSRKGQKNPASVWLARLGLLLQGVVAVAVPGTLAERWWLHLIKVLYAFELFALMLSLVFGSTDAKNITTAALLLTVGVHLLTWVAGDLLRERYLAFRAVLTGLSMTVAALTVIGAWRVLQWLGWLHGG